mmetsp:Transcript_2749/g.5712  ORF Transcript_2749/g.5712 Transcript_2749/m.5712 type:complete len:128 (+) Transcript_2749:695-1078(+)
MLHRPSSSHIMASPSTISKPEFQPSAIQPTTTTTTISITPAISDPTDNNLQTPLLQLDSTMSPPPIPHPNLHRRTPHFPPWNRHKSSPQTPPRPRRRIHLRQMRSASDTYLRRWEVFVSDAVRGFEM